MATVKFTSREYDVDRYEMPYQTKQERKRMPRKKYAIVKCGECGAWVYENWYIRHVKGKCQVGKYPSGLSVDGGYHEVKTAEQVIRELAQASKASRWADILLNKVMR